MWIRGKCESKEEAKKHRGEKYEVENEEQIVDIVNSIETEEEQD